VLELSFKEGQQRAKDNRTEFDRPETAWDALVDTDSASPPPSVRDDADDRRPKGDVPEAVTRSKLLENTADDLERIRLPKLLRRDD
jgi:hypothetical protein